MDTGKIQKWAHILSQKGNIKWEKFMIYLYGK